ncbi:acyl-CoA thioesterase [Pseudomonas umsongensis]|uniref:acyl-CoA thioesterase n=1 Tax=Pseudomonas umsongensis TaxID=198618 RepID=UPI00200A5992|nr:acyl-CoA thioesterase domain-containing protein [Pseudomonas umsongensis]MCK8682704.1 thioesterase family protein [Pseudomonas umsongensis]
MATQRPQPPQSFAELVQLIPHEGLYQGLCGQANLSGNVFGGQLMAQAFYAAASQVEPARALRSLHASFLRPHPLTPPPRYQVEPTLQGRTFSNLDVQVQLQNQACLRASLCFQHPEEGACHAHPFPDAPGPEGLPDLVELAEHYRERLSEGMGRVLGRSQLHELRPVDSEAFLFCEGRSTRLRYWMRSRLPVADDPRLHEAALIYMSDAWVNSPMVLPHVDERLSRQFFAPTLSHSLWFHETPNVNQWLLFDLQSPALRGGTGLVSGDIFDQRGALVASVAQHSLFRQS